MPSKDPLPLLLMLLGIVNLANSVIATLWNVEKSGWTPAYINTHWITSIIAFTAWAHYAMVSGDYFSEVFAFVMNTFCISVCIAAFLADVTNIPIVRSLEKAVTIQKILKNVSNSDEKKYWLESMNLPKKEWLTAYAVTDAVTALLAIPICLLLFRNMLRSNFNLSRGSKNFIIFGLGTSLIVVSMIRFGLYCIELFTLRSSPVAAIGYISYTLDEPAWIGASIAAGAITVMAGRGSYLLRGVALAICTLLIWPAMFFLWYDYRANMGLNRIMPPHTISPLFSMTFTFMELGVLIATSLTLLQSYPSSSKVKFEADVKRAFMGLSIIFLVLGLFSLFLDFYAVYEQVFYRLFDGTEHKLPFMSMLLAIFCYLAPFGHVSAVSLPVCLAVAILTLNSTFFQILAYIWLTYNKYTPEAICPLFQAKECMNGQDPFTVEGSRLHFFETLINFAALVFSAIICCAITRIGRMRKISESHDLSGSDQRKARQWERRILIMGVVMEMQALILFVVVLFSDFRKVDHPLITMYGYLYHIALAIALVVFPLYQILAAERLHEQPVALNTLLVLSAVRFVSIFSQLDYRNTGDNLDREWKLHHLIELFAMFCSFYTIVLILRLRTLGRPHLGENETIPTDFNNPLADIASLENGDGYVQLRAELNI